MRILVDMDGILVNTMPEFLARFNRRTGSHYHMRDLTSFKGNDVFGPEAREVFLEKDFFYSLKPLPGAIDAFNELRKHHEVRVATSAYGPESTDGPRTLSGLSVARLESIPEPGAVLTIGAATIEVLQVAGNAVRTARLRILPAEG